MKRLKEKYQFRFVMVLFVLSFSFFHPYICLAQSSENDIIFKAMQDELGRTIDKLVMENMGRPYFVSYAVKDFETLDIVSSFGALTTSERAKRRSLTVDLRVGDYAFDNTNFIGDYMGIGPTQASLPIEDDYDAIRHSIWLTTDEAYKRSLETLSKKRAYVQNKTITDLSDDFSKEESYTYLEPRISLKVDSTYWVGTVKELSGIFKEYPNLYDWRVEFEAVASNRYFVNSEGSKNRKNDLLFCLEVLISTQAEDGQEIFDFKTFYGKDEKDLPKGEKLREEVRNLAHKTLELSQSKTLTEYTGPVLFTQQAACEFFRQLFAANISDPRTPLVADEGMSSLAHKAKLAGKVNTRIMSDFLNVKDDPTLSNWDQSQLIGGYKVDDEGVKAQPVELVKKGKLVDLLMSRIPTNKVKGSNGHARGASDFAPKGYSTNMIITSDQGTSYGELKNKLIQYCKDAGLEYGIIVKRLKDKNIQTGEGPSFSFFTGAPGREKELTTPLEVYRVWVNDGREEPLRGVEFEGVTVRALKDVLETGNDYFVYNFLLGHNEELPASIVSPSVLIEEMELRKTEAEATNPPYLRSPISKP